MRLKQQLKAGGEIPSVYVDVDGTLIMWPVVDGRLKVGKRWYEGDPEPAPKVNEPLVAALRKWHRDGRMLIIWSRGGPPHAKWAADYCGLKPDACLPKPRICIDDGLRSVTMGDNKGFAGILPHGDFAELDELAAQWAAILEAAK